MPARKVGLMTFSLSQHQWEKIADAFLDSSAHQQTSPNKWLASSLCPSYTALSPASISYYWNLYFYSGNMFSLPLPIINTEWTRLHFFQAFCLHVAFLPLFQLWIRLVRQHRMVQKKQPGKLQKHCLALGKNVDLRNDVDVSKQYCMYSPPLRFPSPLCRKRKLSETWITTLPPHTKS